MKHYRLRLSTLSPVHVATGEGLRPGDYLVANQALYEFGRWGMSRALNDEQRRELLRLLDSDKPTLPLQVQKFLVQHGDRLRAHARSLVPLHPGIQAYCDNRLGQNMQGHIINQLELMRQMGADLGQPYIPGSTLKGTLRGYLLDAINQKRQPPELAQLKEGEMPPRWLKADKLEQALLGFNGIDSDPFAGVLVGDAVGQPELDYWLVNRVRLAPKQADERIAGSIQLAPVECLAAAEVGALTLELRLKPEQIALDPNRRNEKLFARLTDLAALGKMINAVSLPQFACELEWLERNNLAGRFAYDEQASWLKQMRRLLGHPELQARLLAGTAILMRVGKYAGAESKTVEGWRRIKIMRGKGVQPIHKQTATTRCLALAREKELTTALPFGWLLLEDTSQLPDNAKDPLAEVLTPLSEPQARRRQQIRANWLSEREGVLAARRAEEQAAAEIAARKAAEARAEAERQARLASLTDCGRAIEALRERFAQDQKFNIKESSGELRQCLNRTVAQVAADGTAAENESLKALFTEICTLWNADRKKNAKLKELWSQLS